MKIPMKTAMGPMVRRVLTAAAAVVLILGLVAATACAPQPKADTVHLTVKVPRTSHDVVFDESITQIDQVISRMAEEFERDYDKADVDIEVEVFEQNLYDNAVGDALGTDEAPDVLYGDYFNIATYVNSGYAVPMDNAITPEVREDIYGYLWDMGTVEGRTYLMPYLVRQNVLAYSKDLFCQAGLENYIEEGAIGSWTLEEWDYVLDTLARNLPASTYPMMMYAASSQGDTHIMTLLRAAGSRFFDENGRFCLSTPEGVDALRRIQDGVGRGWFPPHSENLEIEDCSSLFRNGQLAIYMINNVSIGRYGDSVGLVNFPGPDEDGCATVFVSGFEVFDNGDPAKVQAAKDFLSYVYGRKDLLEYAAGALPASSAVSDAYADDIYAFDQFRANRGNVVDFTGGNVDSQAVREEFYLCMHDLLMGAATPEETAAAIDERCNEALDREAEGARYHE